MDGIMLFKKKDLEIDTKKGYAIMDMRMEFEIKKFVMLIMKNWKRPITGIQLPNLERIGKLEEKETYKYWRIWKEVTIKRAEMNAKK